LQDKRAVNYLTSSYLKRFLFLYSVEVLKVRKLFTSESVTEGHPDKMCDQISDAILDAILEQDPYGRVACETATTTGMILVMGEISTKCYVDIPKIVRKTVKEIGYTRAKYGFDCDTCSVITSIDEQSSDIAIGVNKSLEAKKGQMEEIDAIGAGDQGMMFGFATNETPEYMPMPISLAHKLAKRLSQVRKDGILNYLRPDGKTQVTIEYEGDKPIRVDTIVVSAQHDELETKEQIERDIIENVIKPIVPSDFLDENTKYLINPTGRFVVGGPQGDSGLTGRKIIVDTYGGYGRHGGGAFSGKDPTKVDRSAAYAARWVAKNLIAAGVADKLEIQLAYAIGVAKPVSINIDTFGTGKMPEEKIVDIVEKVFDLRPAAIIRDLDLRRPIYRQVAAYGHFGRTDIDLPWERLDKVEDIKKYI
jgi:S-adenosylmethionine synthetase